MQPLGKPGCVTHCNTSEILGIKRSSASSCCSSSMPDRALALWTQQPGSALVCDLAIQTMTHGITNGMWHQARNWDWLFKQLPLLS